MTQIWKVILMAILSGLTAFLPVSGSGHLEVLRSLLGFDFSNPLYLDIVLHFGVTLAVIAAFYRDSLRLLIDGFGIVFDCIFNLVTLIANLFREKDAKRRYHRVIFTSGRKFWLLQMISGMMTSLVGLILFEFTNAVISSWLMIGIGCVVSAVVLYFCDDLNYGMKRIGEAEDSDAAVIGTAQGIAVLPGVSRFALTFYLGLKCGLERGFAIKYSFLSMCSASIGALLLELIRYGNGVVTSQEATMCGIGFVVSFVVSILLIRTVLRWVLKHPVKWFSYYNLALGVLLVILSFVVKR